MEIEDQDVSGVSGLEGMLSEAEDPDRDIGSKESYKQMAVNGMKAALDYYFRPKFFERDGKLYEKMGVKLFRKIAPWGDYMTNIIRKIKPNYRPIKGGEQSAKNWEKFTRISEGGHVVLFATELGFTIYALLEINYAVGGIFGGITGVTNAYTIMLQRYNRARIYNILGK